MGLVPGEPPFVIRQPAPEPEPSATSSAEDGARNIVVATTEGALLLIGSGIQCMAQNEYAPTSAAAAGWAQRERFGNAPHTPGRLPTQLLTTKEQKQ